jgi:hypothetical protein
MNVFLLNEDQDFVPPPTSAATADLVADLELATLVTAMAQGDSFLGDVAASVLLAPLQDVQAIRFRQEVLRDALEHRDTVQSLYALCISAIDAERKAYFGLFRDHPDSILYRSLTIMRALLDALRTLQRLARTDGGRFHSPGWKAFWQRVHDELDDPFFSAAQEHLQALEFRSGARLKARPGPELKGSDYLLLAPRTNRPGLLQRLLPGRPESYSFRIAERDESGLRAVADLRGKGINSVANALAQSVDHVLGFWRTLRFELAFYLGCIHLHERLSEIGAVVTFPEPFEASSRRLEAERLYDVILTLRLAKPAVASDLHGDGKDLVLVTGANQGGKSTFLRAVGVAQLMLQSGMFVGAERFAASVASGVFTHQTHEEDEAMRSGKLDEELRRLSVLVDLMRPNALLLLNESFASTNEREGSEIARQVLSALVERRVRVFYVTHLYTCARLFYERHDPRHLFLVAQRAADGQRTFRIVPGEPKATSYGPDLYQEIFAEEGTRDQAAAPSGRTTA